MLFAQGVFAQTVKRITNEWKYDTSICIGEINENNQLNGYGIENSNLLGFQYCGQWENGKWNGYGVQTWPYQKKKESYVGQFKDGHKQGIGTYSFRNGDLFTGQWVNGFINGNGVYTWSNGDQYIGQWVNGKRHGKGILIKKDGTKLIQVYDNEKLVSSVDIEKQANEQSVTSNTSSSKTTSKKQSKTVTKSIPKQGDVYYYQNQGSGYKYCAVLFLDGAIKIYRENASSLSAFKSIAAQKISSHSEIPINTEASVGGKVEYYVFDSVWGYYTSCIFTNSFREMEYEWGGDEWEVLELGYGENSKYKLIE